MPCSPEGVWGKTVFSSSVMMMSSPQSVLIQNTARTLWEHPWLSAQHGWRYTWRTVPTSELLSCGGASSPAHRTAFWLLELLLGIWHLCHELGSEASLDQTGNFHMAKVKAALTIPGTPGAWLRWRMGVGMFIHPWQPWNISYLNHNLSGTVPLLVEFWKLQ